LCNEGFASISPQPVDRPKKINAILAELRILYEGHHLLEMLGTSAGGQRRRETVTLLAALRGSTEKGF
jgi:hypothetical protein